MILDFAPLERFFGHLPKDGDIELSLLKCHLLVEEVLSKIISTGVRRPNHIKEARLSFKQKLLLARAVAVSQSHEWIWTSAIKLNDARNELAHGLETNRIKEKVEAYIQFVESKCGAPNADLIAGPLQRVQWAAFHTFSGLTAIALSNPANTNRMAFTMVSGKNESHSDAQDSTQNALHQTS